MTKCVECVYAQKDSIDMPNDKGGRIEVKGIWCPKKGTFIANKYTKVYAEDCRFIKIIK